MQSLRRILLATDFGPASPLLTAVTIRLARAFGSVVTPVHVIDLNSDSTLVDYFRRQVGQRMMEPLADKLMQERVEFLHPVVLTGPVVDRVLRKAEEIDADLIILGAGEPRSDGTVASGPITDNVIQQARQPVLAIHPGTALPLRRILCPVDGSAAASRGLKNAIRLAQAFQSEVCVLSVVPEVNWMTAAADVGSLTHAHEQYADRWEENILAILRDTDFGGVKWNRDIRYGSPSRAILSAAKEQQVDLIVIGATGKSGIGRMVLGSTTRRVLRELPCSLLVVHDEDLMLEDLNAEDVRTNNLTYSEASGLLAERSYAEALRKFEQVLARNPFHVPALEGRAAACDALGLPERAVRSRRRADILRHETWTE
ncbi:MAG: universal stress protein [Planctomycetaceae bacterium]|nr:universal stress protein [Planctomycetaceae bacterium]